MNIDFKKRAASIVVSVVMAGSTGVAMSAPVFADESSEDVTKVEQTIDENTKDEVKEETKEEVKDEVKEEVKDEVKEEAKEEVKNEIKEETKEEVKNEVKEEAKEEVKDEVKKEQQENNKVVKATRTGKSSNESTNEEHKVSCITTKVDENGKPLKGAVLQIIDSNGNVVDEWISDGSEHESMLPEGEYTLHEVSAPEGYKVAPDKTFTVKVEVKDLDAGVDYSETPCSHYGGTPLYYVESEGEKQEVYCINQDWETPDDNSVYDGKIIHPTDINSYTKQTIYVDAHQNKQKVDISDQTLSPQELYDKVLDIVYHRQNASNLFSDLSEAEIRYVTEAALKNYTNAGLTRVQRDKLENAPTNYESTDYYITDDGKFIWYLYPWYRSFVYDPDAPLGKDVFKTDIGNGDAFGTLARHWSTGHNAKNSEEARAKLARYYELYQYLINDKERHPSDMHLYIFLTNNKSADLSGYDFDGGAYQNLLGIRWFDPYDENYKIYLIDVNHSFTKPDKPEKPIVPTKPKKPKVPTKPQKPKKPIVPTETQKPVVSKTPEKISKEAVTSSPQTGDMDSDYIPYAFAGLAISGVGAGALVRKRKRY